jgi:hypothetical protein
MGATIEQDKSGLWVMRVSGALRKEELDAVQSSCLKVLGPHENVRVLILIDEDFCGWVGTEVWNDMTFFMQHGDRIEKIALVGNPKWEERMLMFTGAGLRRAPIRYFTQEQHAAARAWLL